MTDRDRVSGVSGSSGRREPVRDGSPSAAKGAATDLMRYWFCPVDGTTAPYLGNGHAVACPKCGLKMAVRRV